MFSDKYNYINVPGLGGSSDQNWQTLWARLDSKIINLVQDNWDKPTLEAWTNRLIDTVNDFSDKPVILIAHSMAGPTILHAAAMGKLDNIAGAFMVAFADLERKDFPAKVDSFIPMPRIKLPFPSMMVVSENDEYCSIEKSTRMARIMGSKLINIGKKGHIDSNSNLGTWEVGQNLLIDFISIIE